MKLRFRNNSLRLRVNQREVQSLASGAAIIEEVVFPGDERMTYVLQPSRDHAPHASFRAGTISVLAPAELVRDWADGEQIGIYFDLPADASILTVAIEKDLECVDAPPEDKDPDAFPRTLDKTC